MKYKRVASQIGCDALRHVQRPRARVQQTHWSRNCDRQGEVTSQNLCEHDVTLNHRASANGR